MMAGGHFLRRSRVRNWLGVFLEQIRHPQGSSEDLYLMSKKLVDLGVTTVNRSRVMVVSGMNLRGKKLKS